MKKRKIPIPPGQPTREAFVGYARERKIDEKLAGDQWDIWDAGDWCDNGGNPILNWKGKLITFHRCEYGVFGKRNNRQPRSRATEAQEEYEERQRYKPKDL